jgi:hypothetical protein
MGIGGAGAGKIVRGIRLETGRFPLTITRVEAVRAPIHDGRRQDDTLLSKLCVILSNNLQRQ